MRVRVHVCVHECVCVCMRVHVLPELGLHCFARAFSTCSEGGYSGCGVWASHYRGLSCFRAWALGAQALVVVACRLSSFGEWA